MKGAKRLFATLLALAIVCGAMRFPADAANGGYEVAVLTAQTLTQGTTFDPDTAPETESVKAGDIVVLTLGFRNDSGAAVNVAGFAVKLLYDKEKVTPYTGTAPFTRNAYQVSTELTGDYEWSQAGNTAGDGFVAVSGGGAGAYAVASGAALVLCRFAFQAKSDGAAEFVLSREATRTNVVSEKRQKLALNAFQPFDLTIGAEAVYGPYDITAVSTDRRAGTFTVTLSNPQAVTVAATFFNADKRCMSVKMTDAPAQCGSVEIPLLNASKAKVMLLDSDWKPLCSSFDANIA